MKDFREVISFWFEEIEPKSWWVKDKDFDKLILDRFGETHIQATMGELFQWRESPEGRLAEIIVLDQFSRNIHRDTPKAFAYDSMALALAQECIRVGEDIKMKEDYRAFVYMPFMHSESKLIHEEAVKHFSKPGGEKNLDFELAHKKIIDRFGRYPHRNEILGRKSSEEEIEFLKQPGSSF